MDPTTYMNDPYIFKLLLHTRSKIILLVAKIKIVPKKGGK